MQEQQAVSRVTIESIVRLSSILPRYYRRHCSPSPSVTP